MCRTVGIVLPLSPSRAGERHTCALTAAGRVACWGADADLAEPGNQRDRLVYTNSEGAALVGTQRVIVNAGPDLGRGTAHRPRAGTDAAAAPPAAHRYALAAYLYANANGYRYAGADADADTDHSHADTDRYADPDTDGYAAAAAARATDRYPDAAANGHAYSDAHARRPRLHPYPPRRRFRRRRLRLRPL